MHSSPFSLLKVCDAADYFDAAFDRVLREELGQTPHFHRKLWEYAAIYRALECVDALKPDATALGLGCGHEQLIYSLARRVGKLWATDIYEPDTLWDVARTDDPTQSVVERAPFPLPADRIAAKWMDMREISFPDESFDFCYSSCAIEHIGVREDFIRHFDEVARVLKPGGFYVLTTELTHTGQTVAQPGLHFFGEDYLREIVGESGLEPVAPLDRSLWRHRINYPTFLEGLSTITPGRGPLYDDYYPQIVHLQLLTGNIPFTSVLLTLRKTEAARGKSFESLGGAEAAEFMREGVAALRRVVEGSDLRLDPYHALPGRSSEYVVGHDSFKRRRSGGEQGTVEFAAHTAYVWLGSGARTAAVRAHILNRRRGALPITVYKRPALRPWEVESALQAEAAISRAGLLDWSGVLECDDDYTYAVVVHTGDKGKDIEMLDCEITIERR